MDAEDVPLKEKGEREWVGIQKGLTQLGGCMAMPFAKPACLYIKKLDKKKFDVLYCLVFENLC